MNEKPSVVNVKVRLKIQNAKQLYDTAVLGYGRDSAKQDGKHDGLGSGDITSVIVFALVLELKFDVLGLIHLSRQYRQGGETKALLQKLLYV